MECATSHLMFFLKVFPSLLCGSPLSVSWESLSSVSSPNAVLRLYAFNLGTRNLRQNV